MDLEAEPHLFQILSSISPTRGEVSRPEAPRGLVLPFMAYTGNSTQKGYLFCVKWYI